MGFSFAGAIGAWFADPSRPVVCLIGDGGMGMNSQELQTVVKYGVDIKLFIIQNRTYGITRAYQEKNFEGRQIACGPDGYSSPDFQRVAAAYGVRSYGIYANADIECGIRTVMAASETVICEVVCPDFHAYEPFVKGWDTGIEDMHPLLPRDEFRKSLRIEPLPGWESRK
jgi:acetolactate synthase-1/2/3 large subunit